MTDRLDTALAIAREAGALALERFRALDDLKVEAKGRQDLVSDADREVEHLVRERLAATHPHDAILGEEHGRTQGTSGFTWVIDPIDGTANYVAGIPVWCTVLAGVADGRTRLGVIHDPIHDETYAAALGEGATLNGAPLRQRAPRPLDESTVGVGASPRADPQELAATLAAVLATGARHHRIATGAISLAWLAAGRLDGYMEPHMAPWDCLAGQLIVAEAGGRVESQNADAMLARGGRVVAGTPDVFDALVRIADATWRGGA